MTRYDCDSFGNERYYDDQGQVHRDNDLPAVNLNGCYKEWWKHGKRHREQDKPAVEWEDGTKSWYKNGKKLSGWEVYELKSKWAAIRNGDADSIVEEIFNEL